MGITMKAPDYLERAAIEAKRWSYNLDPRKDGIISKDDQEYLWESGENDASRGSVAVALGADQSAKDILDSDIQSQKYHSPVASDD